MSIGVKESIELRANRTIDVLENGLAYYNYEGNNFRVFSSKENAMNFIETNNSSLIIAEFDTEDELDEYLESENIEDVKKLVEEHQKTLQHNINLTT